MLVVFLQVVFSNQKTFFLGILYFFCRLYNLRVYLFQCVVSILYHRDRKLIYHVLRGREICRLVLYDLGIFQVWFDVRLSLEKLEGCTNFLVVPLFDVILQSSVANVVARAGE